MDAFIITMALSARAIQHGAHRHDRRGIYRCVLLRFRGRIETDHSYGLRCRGLCCHTLHSTRGPAGAAARQPVHSCCAGSGSTNHSSADRIVVNSYTRSVSSQHLNHCSLIIPPASTKLKGGYTGYWLSVCLSICLSVCGQNRVHSVTSTILPRSISYLHILLRWLTPKI